MGKSEELALQALIEAKDSQSSQSGQSGQSSQCSQTSDTTTSESASAAALLCHPAEEGLQGKITVEIPRTGAKAILPLTALIAVYEQAAALNDGTQLDDTSQVSLVLTKLNAKNFQGGLGPNGGKTTLLDSPVGATFMLGASGTPIHVTGLLEPILVTVMKQPPSSAIAAYWNDEAQRWSTEGVTTRYAEDGSMQAATTHLSMFACIEETLESTRICTEADVFSNFGDRLHLVTEGNWWWRLPATLLWILCALLVVGTVAAIEHDRRLSDHYNWDSTCYYIATTDTSLHKPYPWPLRKACIEIWQTFLEISKFLTNPTEAVMTETATYAITHDSHLNAWDIRRMIWKKGDWFDDELMSAEHMRFKLVKIREGARQNYKAFFERPFIVKFWVIFSDRHPLRSLSVFSFSVPAGMRAQLVASRILGALCLSVLFYQVSGIAYTSTSAADCCPDMDVDDFLVHVLVGFVTSVLANWYPTLVLLFRKRGFHFNLDHAALHHFTALSTLGDSILWWLTTFVCLWFLFTVILFLAYVNPKSARGWLWSAAFSLIDILVISHSIYALVIAALAQIKSGHLGVIEEWAYKLGLADERKHSTFSYDKEEAVDDAPEEELQIDISAEPADGRLLDDVPSTQLTEAVPAGSKILPVGDTSEFAARDPIFISGVAGSETNVIKGFGSILTRYPIKFSHPAGTGITKLNADDPLVKGLPPDAFVEEAEKEDDTAEPQQDFPIESRPIEPENDPPAEPNSSAIVLSNGLNPDDPVYNMVLAEEDEQVVGPPRFVLSSTLAVDTSMLPQSSLIPPSSLVRPGQSDQSEPLAEL